MKDSVIQELGTDCTLCMNTNKDNKSCQIKPKQSRSGSHLFLIILHNTSESDPHSYEVTVINKAQKKFLGSNELQGSSHFSLHGWRSGMGYEYILALPYVLKPTASQTKILVLHLNQGGHDNLRK